MANEHAPIVVDGRHLDSGLGTYLKSLLPVITKLIAPRPLVILGEADKWSSILRDTLSDVKVVHAPWPLYSPLARLKLGKIINDLAPTLLWCPQPVVPFGVRCPIVVTVHDLIHFKFKDTLLRQLYKEHLIRHALNRAHKIVVVSAFTKHAILSHNATWSKLDRKITLVSNGIHHRKAPKNKRDYTGHALVVGSHLPHKNILTACQSFMEVADPHAVLHIVGPKGRASAEIEYLCLQSNGRLILEGKLDDEAMAQLMYGVDYVLCPSLYEGFGMIPLESASCGTVAIASTIPAHVEVLGKDGVCMGTSFHQICDCLKSINEDQIDLERLHKLQQNRLKLFSWDKAANLMVEIFTEINSESPSSPYKYAEPTE